jgi:hypothetical protein
MARIAYMGSKNTDFHACHSPMGFRLHKLLILSTSSAGLANSLRSWAPSILQCSQGSTGDAIHFRAPHLCHRESNRQNHSVVARI